MHKKKFTNVYRLQWFRNAQKAVLYTIYMLQTLYLFVSSIDFCRTHLFVDLNLFICEFDTFLWISLHLFVNLVYGINARILPPYASNDLRHWEESNPTVLRPSFGGRSQTQLVLSWCCAHGKRHTQLCLNCSSQGLTCIIGQPVARSACWCCASPHVPI